MPPKHIQISNLLRSEIRSGVYRPNQPLPTEQELTARYHVSRQTVRQALSILVNENLIVRRQGSGTFLTDYGLNMSHRLRSIAVVTTYISDYIFPRILRAVEEVFAQSRCSMALYDTRNQVVRERSVLQHLLMQPVDGVLIEGTKTALPSPNIDLYQQLIASGIPVVFFNACPHDLSGATAVLDDNYGGGYMLTKYLLGLGHKRIGGFFKSDDIQGLQRYSGYISALRDESRLSTDLPIFWYTTETTQMILSPQAITQLEGCTAVVCYNDMAAYSVIDLLTKAGRRVPKDISVVSFDNSQYSELSTIKITSLSHGDINPGRVAAEKLISLIEQPDSTPAGRTEPIPWELHVKDSSGPPPVGEGML